MKRNFELLEVSFENRIHILSMVQFRQPLVENNMILAD